MKTLRVGTWRDAVRHRYHRVVSPDNIDAKAHIFHPDAVLARGKKIEQEPCPLLERRAAGEPLRARLRGVRHLYRNHGIANRYSGRVFGGKGRHKKIIC